MNMSGAIRRRLFSIPVEETTYERRGFRGSKSDIRARLETVGKSFVDGYHGALESAASDALFARLDTVALEWRGFAYEGAAMALALQDFLTPWNRWRVDSFLRGPGDAHAYMIHVGAGWALARLPGSVEKFMSRFDPLLRWLLLDGYGFHEAFFHFPKYLAGAGHPRRVQGYAARAFDQGFGRCLWFVDGGDVERIPRTIAGLAPDRHADLWSGVGLSSTYAGGASEEELQSLKKSAGDFAPQLAQGSAFAAKARLRAGNATPYTDVAVRALTGLPAPEAAQITDDALENLVADSGTPAYESWRRRIQQHFAVQNQLSL